MTYHFVISLSYIHNPVVWRRVAVPSKFTFLRFHKVIQRAFGWGDDHLFQFSEIRKRAGNTMSIGIPDEHGYFPVLDASKIKLEEVFPRLRKLEYEYDFGDSWEHLIVLENVDVTTPKRASLLGGEGACPPEDCGGPSGYERMKLILSNPDHEEYDTVSEWVGFEEDAEWDASAFDLKMAAAQVARI